MFCFLFSSGLPCPLGLQEANSEKTNNGIHYRLQLLYSNGKGWEPPVSAPPPPAAAGRPPAASSAGKPTRGRGAADPVPLRSAHPCARCLGAARPRPALLGDGWPLRARALGRAPARCRRPAPLLTPLPCFRDQDGAGFLRPTHRLHDQAGKGCGTPAEEVWGGVFWGGAAAVGAAPGSAAGRPAEAKPAPAATKRSGSAPPAGKGLPPPGAGEGGHGRAPRSAPAQRRGLQGRTAGTDPGGGAARRVPAGPCPPLGLGAPKNTGDPPAPS